jgi:ribosomal protein S6--L-glutamate ligase
MVEADTRFFLAQQYIENRGFDIKLYVAGTEVFAIAKRSPLHPEVRVEKRLIPLSMELRNLAILVGKLFGLDIYGLDIVETRDGPMVVDINDFPSFGQVPNAIDLVASEIGHIASRSPSRFNGLTRETASEVNNEVAIPLS